MPQVNSYGRTAALTAKEYQREMLLQMMMTGEEAPPPPEPAQDKRKGMPGRNEGKSAAGAAPASFTADTVDRYHLCGCSPYALLMGTSSAMLPPLDRDGYRKQRSDALKEAWAALPQEEKHATLAYLQSKSPPVRAEAESGLAALQVEAHSSSWQS